MSANDWEDDGSSDGGNASDSDLLKDLRKQIKALQKERDEHREQVQKYEAEHRSRTVAQLLAEQGVNEKVAKLVPPNVEPTKEAVEAWVKEYADVLGVAPQGEGTQEPAVNLPPEQVRAFLRMRGTEGTSISPTQSNDLMAKLTSADLTEAQLHALIASGGR